MLFQDNHMMASYVLSNKGIFVNIVFQKPEKQLFGKCYLLEFSNSFLMDTYYIYYFLRFFL